MEIALAKDGRAIRYRTLRNSPSIIVSHSSRSSRTNSDSGRQTWSGRNVMPAPSGLSAKALVLCQKKKRFEERDETLARVNHLRHKRENSFGKRWSTFVRENTARDLRNKRSRSACRKRVVPESICLRRKAGERGNRLNGISPKVETEANDRPQSAREPSHAR